MAERLLKKSLPATAWLEVLSAVLPATGVLVVGAGTGNGSWVQWLHRSLVRPVLLVEGDKNQFKFLQHCCPQEEGWLLRRDIVVGNHDEQTFHQTSNSQENSLVPPEKMRTFWPNLQCITVEVVVTGVTLDSLLEESDMPVNWLILDCLPASSLLQGGSLWLYKLDVAIIRVIMVDDLPSASLKIVDAVLSEAGMHLTHLLPERHPGLAYAIYTRGVAGQNAALELYEAKNGQLQKTLQQTKDNLKHHETLLGEIHRQAEQKAEAAHLQFQALLQHVEKQNQQLESIYQAQKPLQLELEQARTNEYNLRNELQLARNEARNLTMELQKAQSQIELLNDQRAHLNKVLEATNQLVQQQVQQTQTHQLGLKDLSTQLKKELVGRLGNTVRQIESFIAIQQYLTSGDGISNFHGWPISSDLGLFLVECLRERKYDAIVEFGSGTSTLLMAKALQKFAITQNENIGEKPVKPILTFEHDTHYFEKTRNLLISHGVGEFVDLRHSPLREWSDQTGSYLYYDCQDALVELVEHLQGSRKRLLVLVDGPPGSTCANARYPAAPFMLDLIKEHEIYWVLDDAYRMEEKLTANQWKELWSRNAVSYIDELIKNEKGMFVATTKYEVPPTTT